jgi:hypothetical protein
MPCDPFLAAFADVGPAGRWQARCFLLPVFALPQNALRLDNLRIFRNTGSPSKAM